MKLTEMLKIDLSANRAVIVGTPVETNFVDSNDELYFECELASPVKVTCSVDALIDSFETDKIYVRQSALELDGWQYVDEKKPELGYYMPGWVVDFSKGQGLAIYQETTIKKWLREQKDEKKDQHRAKLNAKIKQSMEARNVK